MINKLFKLKALRPAAKGGKGFTLIELVVVIAILGVLAAVTVPLVTGYLKSAKERAYNNDVKQVQAAVDAYYSAPDNTKYIGIRQYPIKGADSTGTLNTWTAVDTSTALATPLNPVKGTQGGNPKWKDNADGIRLEENLNAEAESIVGTASGWHVVKVTRQGTDYVVDTRDYIIVMTKLTGKGLLDGIPASASSDNGGTGSYTYYVDATGKVKTLLTTFPDPLKVGFQDVHP